jgi:hypothetical protein
VGSHVHGDVLSEAGSVVAMLLSIVAPLGDLMPTARLPE